MLPRVIGINPVLRLGPWLFCRSVWLTVAGNFDLKQNTAFPYPLGYPFGFSESFGSGGSAFPCNRKSIRGTLGFLVIGVVGLFLGS